MDFTSLEGLHSELLNLDFNGADFTSWEDLLSSLYDWVFMVVALQDWIFMVVDAEQLLLELAGTKEEVASGAC